MKQLELSPRLALIAGWVPPGAKLADVGTDHAYLPVWLTLHGRVVSAIASDLRKGPLERARATGRTYGAEGIDFRLGDGLAFIRPDEADTIVIAGMGGENIAQILAGAPWTADEHQQERYPRIGIICASTGPGGPAPVAPQRPGAPFTVVDSC